MTREEVHELVGEPTTIEQKFLSTNTVVWKWVEEGNYNTYCAEVYAYIGDTCELEFLEKEIGGETVAILVKANSFKASWLDVLHF
jgi:hypothetical protein